MNRYVVCYDVSDNSKRIKLMKKLKGEGFHSQLSFFEVESSSGRSVVPGVREFLKESDRYTVAKLSRRGKVKRIGGLLEGTEWVL